MEIFSALAIPHIYTSRRPTIFNIPARSGNIQVLSIPWLWRSSILAKEEYKSLPYDALNQEMSRIVTEMIYRESQKVSDESPAVLASHLWVMGSKVGSEQHYTLERDYSLLPSSLALPVFDYIALGHIHSRQSFAMEPPIAYSGSLERIDFSDEDVPKGFYVIEIGPGKSGAKRKTNYKFNDLPVREFITLDIKVETEDVNPQASLIQELSRRRDKIKDAIVRLQIKWPHPHQTRPPDSEVRKSLKEAFLVAEIKWEMAQSTSVRLQNISSTSSLSPLDALGEYLKVNKINPEEASELKSYAGKLLKELELEP